MTVTEKNGTDRNKLLLVNDLAGYGKVALSAMLPILSHMGFELFTLPTALVSNTLDYGKFEILDTKDYIRETLRIWQELGFSFDAVATGFLASDEEAELLAVFCAAERKKGTLIFVNPVLGDDGSLYHGIGEAAVENRKKLLSVADIVKPNYTEACLLTGSAYDESGISRADGETLLRKLCAAGKSSVVITSVPVREADGKKCCLGYDRESGQSFCLLYEEIKVRFPGTGDIFSSILLGDLLRGENLERATARAMRLVRAMIAANADRADKYRGIPVECYLGEI